jgi:hypothetical protein
MARERLHPALVWICADDGTPFGAGALVGSKQVVTCAHVVASVLGIDTPADAPEPAGSVGVRFTHASDPAPRRAAVHPGRWFPPGPAGQGDPGAGDIALLDLIDEPPAAARPVASFLSRADPGDEVHAFGLPPGHGDESGGWASGELAGAQASGWIQIDSPAEGYRIQPGFSGAAAWSDTYDAVVGIIVAAEGLPDTRVAWMIPAATVAQRCPEIALDAPGPAAQMPTGPRVVKVTNVPPLTADGADSSKALEDGDALMRWVGEWFDSAKIVVNLGGDDGVAAGDYFDVLTKHEAVEDAGGTVLGFVDQPGSLIRAAEVQPRFSVCQLENFAYASFFKYVVPARLAARALGGDEDMSPELFAELMAPVAVGDVVKAIPSAEKDARDEVEALYGRSLDDELAADEKESIYRDMVRRADRFLLRFPSGYFADAVLYHKGYALIQVGDFQDALDTFELYRRQYPFGSTEGAERYIEEAKAALRAERS